MSAPNQGRQSPPPEEQSGAQKDAPSDGKGVNSDSNAKDESKSTLEGLSSNPKQVLDDHAAATVSKTLDPDVDSSK